MNLVICCGRMYKFDGDVYDFFEFGIYFGVFVVYFFKCFFVSDKVCIFQFEQFLGFFFGVFQLVGLWYGFDVEEQDFVKLL